MHHIILRLEAQVAHLQTQVTAHNEAITEALAEAVATGFLDVAKYSNAKRGLDDCMMAVSACDKAMSALYCRRAREVQ